MIAQSDPDEVCGDPAVVAGAVVVFEKVPVDQSLVVSTGAAVRERLEKFDVAKESLDDGIVVKDRLENSDVVRERSYDVDVAKGISEDGRVVTEMVDNESGSNSD